MNIQQARAQQASRLFGQPHQHGALTRRQFLKAGLATAVGVGLGQATAAMAGKGQPASAPRPIPYGSTFLFPDLTLFHVEAPGYPLPNPPFDTDPANADPSTITDFNGFVGLVYVGGLGTHHNLLTDETKTLYWEVDLRFMTGQYVGHDGRMHKGTFGFVWLDVYDDQLGQIHDFNPGIAPDGLFWTMPFDPRSVQVDPGSGRAVLQAKDMPMPDYHDFVSSVTGGIPDPGIVSFRAEWLRSLDRHHYSNAARGWEGTFVTNHSTCHWSGRTAKAEFHTDTVDPEIFAEVGHERNGVFFS